MSTDRQFVANVRFASGRSLVSHRGQTDHPPPLASAEIRALRFSAFGIGLTIKTARTIGSMVKIWQLPGNSVRSYLPGSVAEAPDHPPLRHCDDLVPGATQGISAASAASSSRRSYPTNEVSSGPELQRAGDVDGVKGPHRCRRDSGPSHHAWYQTDQID